MITTYQSSDQTVPVIAVVDPAKTIPPLVDRTPIAIDRFAIKYGYWQTRSSKHRGRPQQGQKKNSVGTKFVYRLILLAIGTSGLKDARLCRLLARRSKTPIHIYIHSSEAGSECSLENSDITAAVLVTFIITMTLTREMMRLATTPQWRDAIGSYVFNGVPGANTKKTTIKQIRFANQSIDMRIGW